MYGTCCNELDIWESNSISQQLTPHVCTVDGQHRCNGTECGDNSKGQRYDGVCDKDGCDFNPYRMGAHSFFGPSSSFTLDSTKVSMGIRVQSPTDIDYTDTTHSDCQRPT
jgi:cellulose 1,4-beta-cellobiosidase